MSNSKRINQQSIPQSKEGSDSLKKREQKLRSNTVLKRRDKDNKSHTPKVVSMRVCFSQSKRKRENK